MIPHVTLCALLLAGSAVQEERLCPKCKKKNAPAAELCGGCGAALEPTPRGLAGVGLTAEQVNRAIDRGADYLIARFKKGEYSTNEVFLIGLALAHANALERDPAVHKAILFALRNTTINSLGTYQAGIFAMLLDHLGIERERLRQVAKYLVETQANGGSWGYGKAVPQLKEGPKPKPSLVTVTGGVPLDGARTGWTAIKRENPPDFARVGDNSTTQYAILGLRSAMRRGIEIPKDVWQRCYDETARRYDKKSGGWAYVRGKAYGSMTTAAATTMAIAAHYLGKEVRKDEWARNGRRWMARHFSVTKHPGHKGAWHGYYLYSLERLGRIMDVEFFGRHEWYPLGARVLVDGQHSDGSWMLKDGGPRRLVRSTSFALLFLTRATPALVEEIKRGGSGTLETEVVIPASYFHIILDASGSMLARIDGRPKIDVARDAIGAFLRGLPMGAHIGLRVYGHTRRAIERGADLDSRLEIGIVPLKVEEYLAKLASVRCRGKTPLTYSIQESIGDLHKVPRDEPVIVILLTDGLESTHGAKPWVAAAKLAAARPKAQLHVIGFDLQNPAAHKQLRATAEAGRGTYVAAASAKELGKSFIRMVKAVEGYALRNAEGKEILRGEFGDRHTLKEGKYTIVFHHDGKEVLRTLWINTDRKTRVVVDAGFKGE